MPDGQPLVAIVTGLSLEYGAMRSLLTGLRERRIDGTSVEVGDLPDSAWKVALVEADSVRANSIVNHVVGELRPEALLFVGIAGGLKNTVEVGDLVVATRTYAFQGGKETPEGFYARPQSWHSSPLMAHAAQSALRDEPGVHFGAVAAGDVVFNDARSPLLRQLNRSYNDALAIEMEGAGMAHAAHLTSGVDTLTIRGISDVADAAKEPKGARDAQSRAANRAAQAAAAVLHKLAPPSGPTNVVQGDIHIDFHDIRGNTFFGSPTEKITVESPHEDN